MPAALAVSLPDTADTELLDQAACLRICIGKRPPLDDIVTAHEDVEHGAPGRIVLQP